MWIAGDDLTTTNTDRMELAHAKKSVNAIIIKPNQIGSITETLNAVRLARHYGWAVVISHRSGETNDDFIADLAYGVVADGFKLGAPARGERIAKYNRLLEIEEGKIEGRLFFERRVRSAFGVKKDDAPFLFYVLLWRMDVNEVIEADVASRA